MNWLNIQTKTLRSPEFMGSSPAERAAWLCVLAYSVEQENGGSIRGAAKWKDRQWQQTCGVTLREVRSASRLLVFGENDVSVSFYPTDKEIMVKQKREVASMGGKAKALAYAKAHATPPATAYALADAPAEGEGEGEGERNSKGKEKEKGKENGSTGEITTGKPVRDPLPDVSTDEKFIAELRKLYPGLNIDSEIRKMRAWLLTPKARGKTLTRGRIVSWLNRCDSPVSAGGPVAPAGSAAARKAERGQFEFQDTAERKAWRPEEE